MQVPIIDVETALALRESLKKEFSNKAQAIPVDELSIVVHRARVKKMESESEIKSLGFPSYASYFNDVRLSQERKERAKSALESASKISLWAAAAGGIVLQSAVPVAIGVSLWGAFKLVRGAIQLGNEESMMCYYNGPALSNHYDSLKEHHFNSSPHLVAQLEETKKEIDVALREEIIKRYDLRPQP